MDTVRPEPKYLRRKDAAQYVRDTFGIPCSHQWLAKIAVTTTDGPPFRKVGRAPIYEKADLDAWANSRISRPFRCTSEYPTAA